MNWRKLLGLKEKPLKGEIGLDIAPVAYGIPLSKNEHKCSTCGTAKSNDWYGEGQKDFFGNDKLDDKGNVVYIFWCGECYRSRFIGAMRSSPVAMAKYYQIYGKSPEEVLKINK
jgi:hypothetical protein